MLFGVEGRARLAALPVLVLVVPWRCSLVLPRPDGELAPSAASAKQEPPASRVSSAPVRPSPVRGITLPDEVVVKAVGAGQQAFLRCWARAQRIDPAGSSKVHLHLEIDGGGRVTAVHSDTDSPTLASCLTVIARQLPFPAPGRPAAVDLPLLFQ